MSEEKEIAFKNLKKSVTKGEFKAILNLAKEEYSLIKTLLKKTKDFENKSMKKVKKESIEMGLGESEFDRVLERVVKNLIDRSRNDLLEAFGEQILRSKDITSFINRFQKPGEEYIELEVDFLTESLTKKNK